MQTMQTMRTVQTTKQTKQNNTKDHPRRHTVSGVVSPYNIMYIDAAYKIITSAEASAIDSR